MDRMTFDVQDIADLYGVSTRTVWRLEARGSIPRGVRLSAKTVRWDAREIQKLWRTQHAKKPTG